MIADIEDKMDETTEVSLEQSTNRTRISPSNLTETAENKENATNFGKVEFLPWSKSKVFDSRAQW